MKTNFKKKIVASFAIIGASLFVSGCGKSNNTDLASVNNGLYGGYGTSGTLTPGGCIPVTQPIAFQGQSIYFDSANIIGGAVPGRGQVGQMVTGTGAYAGGGAYQKQGSDAFISMNFYGNQQQATGYSPYAGYPNGTTPIPSQFPTYGTGYSSWSPNSASVTGMVQITHPQVLQQIYAAFPAGPQGAPCVSGIAMNVGHYNNQVYGGQVFLYINGTNHGYALQF